MYDYIILGQGIAGTVLYTKLEAQGEKVLVIDSPKPNTSSMIAAGIMNPITGKRMTLSWEADAFFAEASSYYKMLQANLEVVFYHDYPVFRIFSSITEQNDWTAKVTDSRFKSFVNKSSLVTIENPKVINPHGAMKVTGGGRVDVATLINRIRQELIIKELFVELHVGANDVISQSNFIQVGNFKTKKLVYCTGCDDDAWSFLPFTPMKGEVLEVSASGLEKDQTLVGGCFFSPIKDELYYAGATYDWRNMDLIRTEKAKNEILDKVSKFINCDIRIERHKVGIRPATKDRRPMLGQHPEKNNVFLFSGLGSKGVSMAPLLADQLIQFMQEGKPLNSEVNLNRFL